MSQIQGDPDRTGHLANSPCSVFGMRQVSKENLHRWWVPVLTGALGWWAQLASPYGPWLGLSLLGFAAVWTVFAASTLSWVEGLPPHKKVLSRALILAAVAAAYWFVGFFLFAPVAVPAPPTPSEIADAVVNRKGELADAILSRLPASNAFADGGPKPQLPPTQTRTHAIAPARTSPPAAAPELCIEVVSPTSVAWIVRNCGSVIAREPRVIPVMLNLNRAKSSDGGYDFLRVPSRTFDRNDWIKPGAGLGPFGIESIPAVSATLVRGDRVAGFIRADCPECRGNGRSYWVYWVVGEGGWYSEVPNGASISTTGFARVVPTLVESPDLFFGDIPESARRPIARP